MYLDFWIAGKSYIFYPTLVYVAFNFEKSSFSPRSPPRIGQQPIRFASFHTPTDHSYGQHAQKISGNVFIDTCHGEKKRKNQWRRQRFTCTGTLLGRDVLTGFVSQKVFVNPHHGHVRAVFHQDFSGWTTRKRVHFRSCRKNKIKKIQQWSNKMKKIVFEPTFEYVVYVGFLVFGIVTAQIAFRSVRRLVTAPWTRSECAMGVLRWHIAWWH